MKGQVLANAYAAHLSRRMGSKCHGFYDGGGWISVSGEIKRFHPDYEHKNNSWSMLVRKRSGEIRRILVEEAIPEWARYEAINKNGQVMYFQDMPVYRQEMGVWIPRGPVRGNMNAFYTVAAPNHPELTLTEMYQPEQNKD